MQETHRRCRFNPWVRNIPWKRKMATLSSILAERKIPRTEKSSRLHSKVSQSLRHDCVTKHPQKRGWDLIKDWWVGHLTHSSSFNSELGIHRLSVGQLDFAGQSISCFWWGGHLRATWVFFSILVQVSPLSCTESASNYSIQVLGYHSDSGWQCLALFLPTICRNQRCVLSVDSHKHICSLLHDRGFTWAACLPTAVILQLLKICWKRWTLFLVERKSTYAYTFSHWMVSLII